MLSQKFRNNQGSEDESKKERNSREGRPSSDSRNKDLKWSGDQGYMIDTPNTFENSISSSFSSLVRMEGHEPGGRKEEEDVEDDEDKLLYFKANKIYNLSQSNKDILEEKNEYVPDLDYNSIVRKWEIEEYLDQQRELQKEEPSPKVVDNSNGNKNNKNNITLLSDKSSHSQVEPIPLPNLKTLVTSPSSLELQRRSSYLSLLNNVNNSNNNASSNISNVKTGLRQPFNPLFQKYSSPFVPRSRRTSSLRRFSSPLTTSPIPNPDIGSSNNQQVGSNNNNYNVDTYNNWNIAAPLPIIPTDTTLGSIDVNMSDRSRSLDEASFSSTSLNQLPYRPRVQNLSSVPIMMDNDRLSDSRGMTSKQYLNNNNLTKQGTLPIENEELFKLVRLLPSDFLSLPYSQRKAKLMEILPKNQLQSYKIILSLIKKVSINSPRSTSSLGSCAVDIPSSLNNNDSFNNNKTNDNNDSAFGNRSGVSLNRHNSVASQFLSTFSPSTTSMLSLNNNSDMGSSLNSNLIRPSEKGMQLFDHTLGGIVGFGAWGMIRKCKNNNDGSLKAIKIIKFKNNEKIKERVLREIKIWNRLKHQNILPLINYQIDNNYAMYCLTELVEDGTLYDLVLSWDNFANAKIPYDTRCKIVIFLSRQIIDALKYLHKSIKIIHGDIKLENCLLNKNYNPKQLNSWQIVLCDFGMSHFIKDCSKKQNDSQVGSLPYASPELLFENKLCEKSDIWALGVMLYTMLLGKLPFKHPTESKLRELIKSGKYDKQLLQQVCSNKYKELMEIVQGCLIVDLNKRWDLDMIENKLNYLYKKWF